MTPANAPPFADQDTAETDQNHEVTVNVLQNDSDPDGDTLTVTSASAANGSVAIDGAGNLIYTPNQDFIGTDTINYTIDDGNGASASNTVTVTINAIDGGDNFDTPPPPEPDPNTAPIAIDDSGSTIEDVNLVIDVVANDLDTDGDPLRVFSATAENGRAELNDDGTLTYIPNPDFFGEDTLSYEVTDGRGDFDVGEAFIAVSAVNDAPRPQPQTEDIEATYGEPLVIDVVASVVEVEGEAITLLDGSATNGTVQINQDNTLTYTAQPGYEGEDTISYRVEDPNGASAQGEAIVQVAPPNNAPVAQDDTVALTGDRVFIDVLENDVDPDGEVLTLSSVNATGGEAQIAGFGVVFTQDDDPTTQPSLTYSVTDGQAEDQAQVLFNVAEPPPLTGDGGDDTGGGDDGGGVGFEVLAAGGLVAFLLFRLGGIG